MAEASGARRRPSRFMAVAAAIALLALAAWFGRGWLERRGVTTSGDPGEPTYRVTRGPLVVSFTERGSIMAAKSEQVFCELEGSNTLVNVVPEGTYVQKGDILVELDASELTQAYNLQSIAVETARAALTQADKAVEIQKSQNGSDIMAAEVAVILADIDVEKYEQGDWGLSLAKAKADIHIADEELKRAENKYVWTEKLAAKGYVTRLELIADDLAVKKAKVQAEQATRGLAVLEKYTRKKDQTKVTSDLEQATRALARVKLKAESQLAQVLADQEAKKSTLELSLRRLEKIKDQLAKTKILAPQAGMVVYSQDGRWGRDNRIIEQGATVNENQHLIDLPDLSTMAVEVQIPEARIHQIELGLQAIVTIDASTDVSFRGTLTKIGLLPDYVNRWLNPDLKVYKTKITIDPDQDTSLLRPGMSAKVETMVASDPDVLFVPVQSVTTIDGAPVCILQSGGEFHSQPVEVGLANDSFVVIATGLKEGDIVKLTAPRPQGTARSKKESELEGPKESGGSPAPAAFREEHRGGGDAERAARRAAKPGGMSGGPPAGTSDRTSGLTGGGGLEVRERGKGKRSAPVRGEEKLKVPDVVPSPAPGQATSTGSTKTPDPAPATGSTKTPGQAPAGGGAGGKAVAGPASSP